MLNRSIKRGLAVVALLGCGLAMAQAEPTLNQVYEAAHAGKLDQAQTMMQQVLVAHPNSAKAHFVQAELSAQQGQAGRAREELALAEKLAPGLPFAKPAAVQSLRSQLAAPVRAQPVLAPQPASAPFPWGMVLLLGGGAVALVLFLTRKRVQLQPVAPMAYGAGTGLSGPQTFGAGPGAVPAYGQPGYGQPTGSGLGGQVMGGLATGLAVGAGVMAAQAIGKSLMGHDTPTAPSQVVDTNYEPLAGNGDMGGQDFGVADSGSWDDGGAGGGGDWDN